MTSLEILMERYRRHLETLNYSSYSWKNRASSLRQFIRFLSERKINDAQMVTSLTLAEYRRWLFDLPTKWEGTARMTSTLNRALTALRQFFRFLKEEGCIGRNPAEDLELGREPDRLPRNVLTPQEAKKIIECADPSTARGHRDRTMLEILYATGIRLGELIRLNVEDVNLEEGLLVIRQGKGKRDRVVPLGQVAGRFLETHLKAVRPELAAGASTTRIFLSRFRREMSAMAVGAIVTKYTRLAGVKKHVTCHLWRHTCATHLVQNRANLRHVQEILGHRNLSTTERYLSLTINDLKEAHRRFHPREKGLERES